MITTSSQPTISLDKVSKVYDGRVHALVEVSLDIHQGDALAIMGKSGSGKSTLLSLLGLLDTHTGGSYFFMGRDVSRLTDDELSVLRNRHIGFVFQSFHLLPQLDVMENIEVPLFYRGVNRTTRRKIALELIEQVGLKQRAHHFPTQLSGGEQQRVAIARALTNQPQVLLADEPTGSLDTSTGEEIMAMIKRLNEKGVTIIMVTHDPKLGNSLAKKIELSDGRLAKQTKGNSAKESEGNLAKESPCST